MVSFFVVDARLKNFHFRLLRLWICWFFCFTDADNNKFSMEFFQVLLNIPITHYGFCLYRFNFLFKFCFFSFTLTSAVSFYGLKCEVAYLVLSVIDSIQVSRAVVTSINTLELFRVLYSLDPLLKVFCLNVDQHSHTDWHWDREIHPYHHGWNWQLLCDSVFYIW